MAEPHLQRRDDGARLQDLSGTTIGRFAIRARLGAGGMGEVYRADDTKLKRPVALKRIAPHLRADPHFRQRFLREAECASRLNDPHIASVYDVFEAGGDTFLVMEYVEGQTLRQRLRQSLSVEDFLGIATQCAAALAAAHERGIIHRDLKPENILLTPAGDVKILDFGVARRLPRGDETSSVESQSGILGGTPAYMPPEVLLEKEPDGRSDIFSLGVVFYEALTGRNPFRAETFVATSNRVLKETPPPMHSINPQVPAELERIVAKMLAKNPDERYATAADLLVDLRAAGRVTTGAVAAPVLTPRKRARTAAAAALLALVAILIALAAIPSMRQRLRSWLGAPVPQEKQVAVLPFAPVGGDPQAAAFSDGLTETLTTKLMQLTATHSLQVISATEVQARHIKTVEQARKEFGVTLALAGSLHRAGDLVRVNCALVDTRTGRQLRAESITAAAADPFAVQDQVVIGAVQMLELEVEPRERQALEAHGTQVPDAFDFYLQGRGYLQNYDRPENLENAIRVFEQALQLDPSYALAYAGLGDAYWMKYRDTKDSRWVESSRRACERAASLDARLPAALVCLGTLEKGTGQYEEAVAAFGRAVEAEPTNDDAYRGLAEAYERLGNSAEAEKTYGRAIALRPQYWAGYNWLGVFYFRQARYREAAEMFQKVVTLAPDSVRGHYNLGATYVAQGRYADAIPVVERSINIRPDATAYTNLGNAYFYFRRYDAAVRAYEEAVRLNPADALLWWNLGDGYYWDPGKRGEAGVAYRRAIALTEKNLRVNPRDAYALGIQAICHAMLGEKRPALESLQKGLQIAPADPEMRFKAALVYNQSGEVSPTLAWLEEALVAGYSPTVIRDTPNFDALRGNARFQELLRKK